LARLNLDAQFFADKRIDRLAQVSQENPIMVRGRLIMLYMHCYNQRSAIVKRADIDVHVEWLDDKISYADLMVRSLLADDLGEDQFRIRGVADRIGYLEKRSEAGKKSVEVRREKLGSAQPPGGRGHKIPTEHKPNRTEHVFGNDSNVKAGAEPNTPSRSEAKEVKLTEQKPNICSVTTEPPSPSPDINTEETTYVVSSHAHQTPVIVSPPFEVLQTPPIEDNPGQRAYGIYCDVFKKRYGNYPTSSGKDKGRLKSLVKELGLPRTQLLLHAYLQMNDQWFLTKRHPIDVFLNNLTSVGVYADGGAVITRKQAQAIESGSNNAQVLGRLLEKLENE
jgi:hypothetical protein